MFLLGHIGITVGIVYLLVLLLSSRKKIDSPHTPLTEDIDFRVVIIAAIFADIIDKIVGMIILKDEIANGRIFMHSMVVIGILSICVFIIARERFGPSVKPIFYIVPLWIHLALDEMWGDPHTLFWPLFGTSFLRIDLEIRDYFTILLTDPYVILTEILGAVIITTLFIRHRLFIKTHLLSFLRHGRLKTCSNN